MSRRVLSLLLLLALGCATPVRFKDQPVVWRVDDTRHIAEPEANDYSKLEYMANVFLLRRSTRALELRSHEPARSSNALDEVPDSTWFENRIGRRTVTPEEAARGPGRVGPPQLPLLVTGGKVGGGNPGFLVKDNTGRKFLIKFDTKENPEQQTATDVIAGRLLWTVGYHVPADYVLVFARSDLSISPEAKISDAFKNKRPLVEDDVALVLASSPLRPDGRYRALASEFLPGKPLGGVTPEGTRKDDANDTIPHEYRRELRGLRVFGAWLNHTDMKEDNTLDMYVSEGGRSFVRHYLVDFGEAFAAHASEKGRLEDGYEHFWDWERQTKAAFAFGLWTRPWERLTPTRWPAVGVFSADHFDPEDWREAYPYWPIVDSDQADAYWAAKVMMRIDRPILEAVVREAQLSDPAAGAYLVDTLLARRDKVGAYFLEQVSPLDDFQVEPHTLCGVDRSVRHGLAGGGVVELLDEHGGVRQVLGLDGSGSFCLPLPQTEGYQVLQLRTRRQDKVHPALELHIHAGPGARILGLIRH